ncbi:MAG: HD domain-containing protein [Lachnospiraceae bacterium]|nr:HD domain-containing protein [Lachnospiraceae bacterium]
MTPARLNKEYSKHRELHKKLDEYASDILSSESFQSTRVHVQHGSIPVHRHCIDVAKQSLTLSHILHARVNEREMTRGALLHDYFLYDWHNKEARPKGLHGYTHPDSALRNAQRDFDLSDIEKDIIRSHMWPLTLRRIPQCKEAWIVTLADKYCSTLETLKLKRGAAQQYIENRRRNQSVQG